MLLVEGQDGYLACNVPTIPKGGKAQKRDYYLINSVTNKENFQRANIPFLQSIALYPIVSTSMLVLVSRPTEGRRLSWLERAIDKPPTRGCLEMTEESI